MMMFLLAKATKPDEIEEINGYIHDYWFEFDDVDRLDWEKHERVVRLQLTSDSAQHSHQPRLELVIGYVESVRVAEESGTGEYDVNRMTFDPSVREVHLIGNVAIDMVFRVERLQVEVLRNPGR